MDLIGLNSAVIEDVTKALKGNLYTLSNLDVYDTRFYPPRNDDPERVLRYFMTMVAIDHRVSRPGKPYYFCFDDGCYSGADLLYRLGMMRYLDDADFFSPDRLSRISVSEVLRTFSVDGTSLPDPEVRTMLLRDLGLKLVKLYGSSVSSIIESSNNRIRGSLSSAGLAENLRVFRAYEDPVDKKTMLLAKFLTARGFLNPLDEIDVAVDNHLVRIAYRLGLVFVSGSLWRKIKDGIEVSYEEDILLRLVIRAAYKQLAIKSGIKSAIIDDHFWITGRGICLRDRQPLCHKCMFNICCRAREHPIFMVNEHIYYDTWYY
ncbi:MAG: hypothetical protein RMH77_03030 [Sulfolobales archaeon]|nr:hypothetical protein [Sulfolobales archaeon]MDW7969364.1 hypothetical protein [Sulfolobales archaeon]